ARVENGCMQFVPGSHHFGPVPHESREHYLQIRADYLEPHLSRAVPIEVDPGDVVLFHNLLFHQGLPNRSRTIRWSLDWRYQDATQPTLRAERGHIARSCRDPASVVSSAAEWARLTFGEGGDEPLGAGAWTGGQIRASARDPRPGKTCRERVS